MATSQSGRNYIVSFIPQVTIGTPVIGAGGTVIRTLASQGFSYERAEMKSPEIRSDGMGGNVKKGVVSVPASYLCPLTYGTHDSLFEAFLRGAFSVGVLSPGTTRKIFTVDEYFEDLDLSAQAETVRVLSMGVKIPAEGDSQITWGLMGRDATALASGASPSLTTPTLSTTEPMFGIDATITGPAGISFSAVDFTMTRSGGVQAVIGNKLSPDIYDGPAEGTGTISGTMESLALLTAVAADTAITLTIVQPDAAGNSIQFALSGVQVSKWQAPLGGDKALIQSAPFSFGGANALVITNTAA